eukprot:m.319979 g.319979  ORF g.319979 m.319979 type:complete len:627 (-) comp20312_c1_seq1:199-2079(-)
MDNTAAMYAVGAAVVGGAATYFMFGSSNEKQSKKSEKTSNDVKPKSTPPAKVVQVDAGPNEKRRARKAMQRERRQAEEAAAEAARKAAAEKERIRIARLDKEMREAAAKRHAAQQAEAAQRKKERLEQMKAEEKERAERKAARVAAEEKAKKEAKERAAARAKLAEEQKAADTESAKRRAEKKKKQAEEHARRKREREEAERRVREAEEARKAKIAEEEAEAAAIRKAERDLEAMKRSKSANWEQAAEAAGKARDQKRKEKAERQQRRIEKNSARAAEKLKVEIEIATAVAEEKTSAAVPALTDGGDAAPASSAKFTIERAIPDEPEPEEEAEEDDSLVERVKSAGDYLRESESELHAMQIKIKNIKSRTDKISGHVLNLSTGVKDADKQNKGKSKAEKKKPEATKPDPLAAPASVPTPSEAYTTYADDAALGKPAPSLDTLEYIKGDPIKLGNGKVTLIQIFAKFAKGDYTTVQGVSDIAAKFGDRAQYLGISIDPAKEEAESFIKKIGTSMPEIYIDNLTVPYPLAWDQGKTVKEAFRKLSGLMALGQSATFLVDGNSVIVWREQFGQGYPPAKGQLEEQLRRLLKGETLLNNGPNPKQADEEDEEEEMDVGDVDSDDDLGLGF